MASSIIAKSAKVVMITGCTTGGIGHQLCQEFAKRGCLVYATSRKAESMTGFTLPNIKTKALDVCDEVAVNRVSNEIISEAGRIDILVSNAGYMEAGAILDMPPDRAQAMFDTNTFGTLRLARAIIPRMAERRSGLFLIIGSVGGLIPTPWTGIYASSKAALHSIADNLQMECKPLGVKCMLVAPGGVKSQIAANSSAKYDIPETSLYKNYSEAIISRMWTSQTSLSMSTDLFCEKVVNKALESNPPSRLSVGGGAIIWKFLAWLPRWLSLWLFWRFFGKPNKKSG